MQQDKSRRPTMLEAALGPAEYAARMEAAAQQGQQGMEHFNTSPSRQAGPICIASEPPNPLQTLLDAGSRAGPELKGAHSSTVHCSPLDPADAVHSRPHCKCVADYVLAAPRW